MVFDKLTQVTQAWNGCRFIMLYSTWSVLRRVNIVILSCTLHVVMSSCPGSSEDNSIQTCFDRLTTLDEESWSAIEAVRRHYDDFPTHCRYGKCSYSRWYCSQETRLHCNCTSLSVSIVCPHSSCVTFQLHGNIHTTIKDTLIRELLTLWRPLLPYGYSYKTSRARPG